MMSMVLDSSLNEGISVIICCYNSEWIIARCLEALKRQQIPEGLCWEVVLVDNNCNDNTVQLATETMRESGIDFSVVSEQEQGLMKARKRGIANVKYKYCIYCDDDNLLCPEYVEYVYRLISTHSEVGAVGGKGIPEFECEPAPSILEHLTGYAVGSQLQHPNYLFGAGLTLRTEVVRTIYEKFPCVLVGRKGNVLLAGDDLELVNYVKLMGYSLMPTDNVSFTHVLSSNRLTEEYRLKMFYGLFRALPVGDVMELALQNKPVSNYVKSYLKSETALFLRQLIFWKKQDLSQLRSFVRNVRFWGIRQLLAIYWTSVMVKTDFSKKREYE